MGQQEQVLENIKDTVQQWVDGKVSKTDFDAFLKCSNQELDALVTEKKRRDDEDWWRYSTTFC
jgi:hypothetical protein